MTTSASVKDVARRAGVSLGTVSNVLNHPDRVRDETRERVQQAIADLGFVRNESARQLRAGQSRVLSYLVPSTDNPFFTDVARGAREAARPHSQALVLCSSDGSAEFEVDHLRLLGQLRVQGVLLTPVHRVPDEELAALQRQGVGVVVVDRPAEGQAYCSVSIDDVAGGRLAVEHLIERGHRRIAFVGDPDSHGQVADRLQGAREAIIAAGLGDDSLVLVPASPMSIDAGWLCGDEVRAAGPAPVSAAYCANDLLALGLLQYAVSHGIAVPDELAIAGHDDIDFAAGAAVPLTSVRQPREELGRTAVELLGQEADGHVHRHEVFTPELVVRASTGGPS
ncbi:MAG TPA: LacI family DNA-binding transcriptional regulator [Candidatus Avipropionibacterium avicola]|uniref:LacI family DNA-binding transcriptional regulator n=1 Tax=Candidatus Avipropionibacterium avicola TaxID=2840701 RepID=A0A9D1H0P9_9ACTN|nr:LacI family DNA-binding transcriptional regulator [Candidatus Avipropionibacterium avicola]